LEIPKKNGKTAMRSFPSFSNKGNNLLFVLLFISFFLFPPAHGHSDSIIAGDIDDSKTIDLKDAVSALQTCLGIKPLLFHKEADVDGDGRIGIQEVIS